MLIPAGKRSGFYTIVSITIWSATIAHYFLSMSRRLTSLVLEPVVYK